MSNHVLGGEPPIEVILKRSARARRFSLRVSSIDGRVTLTLPNGANKAEALGFAETKADWIRAHLARRPPEVAAEIGAVLPFRGTSRRVVAGSSRSVQLGTTEISVPGDPVRSAARLKAFYREEARARLTESSDRYAAALGLGYGRLTLRDPRSRWGSCSSKGNLMFSWRLVMAPDDVLDYVAAHEVAHLAEMNHSPRFWAEVQRLYGDHAEARRWLKSEGIGLHRYRF